MEWAELFAGVNAVSVLLFLLGIGFLIIEMFHPGFGVFGILGILCLLVDVLITAQTLIQGLVLTGIVLAVVLIMFLVFLGFMSKGRVPKRLVLAEKTDAKSGFSGVPDLRGLVGKRGTLVTALRPAGIAVIEGGRYDVVSRGEYLVPKTDILVVDVEGNRVVVSAVKTADAVK